MITQQLSLFQIAATQLPGAATFALFFAIQDPVERHQQFLSGIFLLEIKTMPQ
jgi:hypothetical protein